MPEVERLDVVVVGPCAAGKSTLVERLGRHGLRARSVAQEHSNVPSLFRRAPARLVVYLDVSYEAVRHRRPVAWGPERLEAERARLSQARREADLVIATDGVGPETVAARVVRALAARGGAPSGPAASARQPCEN